MDPMTEFNLTFTSYAAKIKALKATLSPQQLEAYNASLLETKKHLAEQHEESDTDLHKLLDRLYC